MQDDDEISIDFSKIKKFFKGKTESDRVKEIEEKTENLDYSKEDKKEVEHIQENLVKQETEAAIIDGEKRVLDKKLDSEEEKLSEIEDSEEEISFDFSKVKKMFKGTKEQKTITEESDDIAFDFSKVKSFFKNMFSSDKQTDDEYSVDIKKSMGFVKNHFAVISLIVLLLIPIVTSVYLRSIPASLPITEDWARNAVYNDIRNNIRNEIRGQYPNLPQANIDNLVGQQFDDVLKQNKAAIDQQIVGVSAQFKSRLQKDSQTYLLAIDPYFWLRHAQNVLKNGHPGDELRNYKTLETCTEKAPDCIPWDTHMIAPLGRPVPGDMFNAYFQAYVHKFMTIFNPNRDIMSSAFIVPILVAALGVIPAFFLARKLGGNFGGFIAAFLVAVHPAFLTRTAGGFADTDAYNVVFPLVITWLFLEALDTKNWKLSVGLTALTSFLIATYIKLWAGGWWYIFDFLLASIIGYIIIFILIHRGEKHIFKEKSIKQTLVVLVSFFIFSLIFVSMIANFATFNHAFGGPVSFTKLKEVGIDKVWPNVFTTVAEQNPASLNSVVDQIGMRNRALFLLAIIGISLTLVKKNSKDKKDLFFFIGSAAWLSIIIAIRPQNLIWFLVLISIPIIIKIIMAIYYKNKNIDFKLAIILIIWFTTTTYASTKGVRFILMLVPAFAIGIGIFCGIAYKYISNFTSKNLYLNRNLAKVIVLILISLLLVKPYNTGLATAKQEIPSMNDAWYQSLDRIRQESQPDAIINSWWDFGHWFKAVGDRATTFDGTSQNTPMAHWIGHTLLTNNEDKAIGILRMLDCASNNAFDILDEDIKDTAYSVSILHEIVVLDKADARKHLLDYVDEEKADKIIENTHCDPPENYYITSDDMIGKSGVWAHFGIWNFDRALVYNRLKKGGLENNKAEAVEFMKERFNYSETTAEQLYFEVKAIKTSDQANRWIAPWPSYASQVTGCSGTVDKLLCPIVTQQARLEMEVNINTRQAVIKTPGDNAYPNAIVFPTEDGVKKTVYHNNTLGYSVTMMPSGSGWAFVLTVPPLEDSMFTRLFFLDGHGLKHFEKFSDERSVTGNRIVVWKVDWEGMQENVLDRFKPPVVINESSEQ